MTIRRLLSTTFQSFLCLLVSARVHAQEVKATQTTPVPSPTALPFPALVKKSVAFIKTDCLKEPTPDELSQMTLDKQAQWKPDALVKLTPQQLATMPHVSHLGTGFMVAVPAPDMGANQSFKYLVTNRHVALPGVEEGMPCKVVNQTVFMNHTDSPKRASVQMGIVQSGVIIPWVFPLNDAVDLAASPAAIPDDDWDYTSVGIGMFATREMVDQYQIVEGDPVFFGGLFIQYHALLRCCLKTQL